MRTKTTILSAVALAAGLLSSNAQVYSANVVGYYNVTTPVGTPGHAKNHLIANQLMGAGGSNDVNVVLQAGLSDANSQGVDLALWNGATFIVFTYYGVVDSGGVPGFYDGTGNYCTNKLNQGVGAFLVNYSGLALTNTFIGTVVQGPITNTVQVGSAPYAIKVPVSTNMLSSITGIIPASQTETLSQKVDYFHYNVGAQNYDGLLTWYGIADSGTPTGGWYDGLGNDHTFDATLYPLVGEGFTVNLYGGASAYQWVSSFTVQ